MEEMSLTLLLLLTMFPAASSLSPPSLTPDKDNDGLLSQARTPGSRPPPLLQRPSACHYFLGSDDDDRTTVHTPDSHAHIQLLQSSQGEGEERAAGAAAARDQPPATQGPASDPPAPQTTLPADCSQQSSPQQ